MRHFIDQLADDSIGHRTLMSEIDEWEDRGWHLNYSEDSIEEVYPPTYEQKTRQRARTNTLTKITYEKLVLVTESAKAWLVKDANSSEEPIWFPKSKCRLDIQNNCVICPWWLVKLKADEVRGRSSDI